MPSSARKKKITLTIKESGDFTAGIGRVRTVDRATVLFLFGLFRHPLQSTLFPYTTLFRSPGTAAGATTGTPEVGPSRSSRTKDGFHQSSNAHDGYRPNCLTTFRSEEHTSELQSQSKLVCRLLLEKKKSP